MPTADLKRASIEVNDGLDAIVIVNDLGDVPGGRTLDVSGLATDVEVIRSGHILIQNDTTKAVKPLGVTSEAYDTPARRTFVPRCAESLRAEERPEGSNPDYRSGQCRSKSVPRNGGNQNGIAPHRVP